ncbi:MAG TPA: ABC transporter permease, partial [Terriglobia bacterium]|nr:ABC transporter permease [Terriglobia bacterium]
MNFKYALRSARKNPLITTVAILSLALGIGANTAIFSLIDQLLLRMLPVEGPQQLVQLAARGPYYGAQWGEDRMSYPMYRDFRDKATVFSGVLAWYAAPASLGYGGRTELIRSELVTGDYFQVLGVKTAVGRAFAREDNESPGAEPFAMLTYDFWKSRFGADPNIVGETIRLNGNPMTVIGVSAPGFRGLEIGDAAQVFVPMMMQQQVNPVLSAGLPVSALESRRSRWVNVFARLKPGVGMAQAQAAVAPLYRQIIEMEVTEAGFRRASENTRQQFLTSHMDVFDGSTGRSALRKGFTTPLYVLMAITGLVLLIACANVANLLIARATARQKEIAVLLALGAGRRQIVAQLMVESLLLSATAAAAGLGLGVWINRGLLQFLPTENSSLTLTAALDGRVLAFSLAIALATAFIFGLAPALQATKPHLSDTLKN